MAVPSRKRERDYEGDSDDEACRDAKRPKATAGFAEFDMAFDHAIARLLNTDPQAGRAVASAEAAAADDDLFAAAVRVGETPPRRTSLLVHQVAQGSPSFHTPAAPAAGAAGAAQRADVWVDGACSRNGQAGAKAGWGVYFGPDDARNASEPLAGAAQTNQRAELSAAICALERAPAAPCEVHVHTDSKYVIQGITEWIANWRRNGWMNAQKKPVSNADLWTRLDALARLRGTALHWHWVKGHSNDANNDAADRLACLGAAKAGKT